jgi:hypothetical protein
MRGKVVVEKKLAREQNLSRHDLGREAFVSKVRTSFSDPDPQIDFGDPGSGSAVLAIRIRTP